MADKAITPQFSDSVITFTPSFSTNNKGFKPAPDTPSVETNDYEELIHKPKINGVTLLGDKTAEELGIECRIQSISVNQVDQQVINKNVDIEVPTDNAQLQNGAGYQKSNDIQEMSFQEIKDIWDSIFN